MRSKFAEAGRTERKMIDNWAKRFFAGETTVNHTSEEGYDRHDAEIAAFETGVEVPTVLIIEAKVRNKHYPTQMIEKPKYDYLMSLFQSSGYVPVYLVWTPKGYHAFDLSSIEEPQWQEQQIVWHSCQPEDGMITKQVGFIDVSKSYFLAI